MWTKQAGLQPKRYYLILLFATKENLLEIHFSHLQAGLQHILQGGTCKEAAAGNLRGQQQQHVCLYDQHLLHFGVRKTHQEKKNQNYKPSILHVFVVNLLKSEGSFNNLTCLRAR